MITKPSKRRLALHAVLKGKVEAGEQLTSEEENWLRSEYEFDAPGISEDPSLFEFVESPRETLIGHVVRVYTMGWLTVRYTYAAERYGVQAQVVELGCGRGELPRIIHAQRLAQGSRIYYTGFDLDLRKASRFWAASRGPRTEFRIHDIREGIPFGDGAISVVVSTEFLEHVDRTEGASILREAYRVLQPNGYLLVTSPDATYKKGMDRGVYHVHEWEYEDLRQELLTVGFTEIDHFWFFVPLRTVDQWLPRFYEARVSSEWLRAALGPASGEPGATMCWVVQKRSVPDGKGKSTRSRTGR